MQYKLHQMYDKMLRDFCPLIWINVLLQRYCKTFINYAFVGSCMNNKFTFFHNILHVNGAVLCKNQMNSLQTAPDLNYISVLTSFLPHTEQNVLIKNINWLMLVTVLNPLCCQNHAKYNNEIYGKSCWTR